MPETPEPAGERETLELEDGTQALLIPREGGWTLEVDGIRQSHVGGTPDETPGLAVSRWMLAAVGAERDRVVHLGGGLLTLPRAIAAVRPEAHQLVVELDPVLAQVARERFGVPELVELMTGDARAWLDGGGSEGWTGDCDAVVIDVFAGGLIPPAFTSRECFGRARSLLAPGGVLVLNSVAGGGLSFTRRELATLRAEFDHVAMIVQGSALQGLRFGNAVLIGSPVPIEVDRIKGELAGDASRGALVTNLDELVGDADVVLDADELWSPEPDLPDLGGALRLIDQARSLGTAFAPRQED